MVGWGAGRGRGRGCVGACREAQYLRQADFKPLLQALLGSHPGLEFLKDAPEFQERYVETVIYRIFYSVDRSSTGSISLRELKRSNLLEAMFAVDEEEDINKARVPQLLCPVERPKRLSAAACICG